MPTSTLRRLITVRGLHIASPYPPPPASVHEQPRVSAIDYSSIPLQELRRELHHRALQTKGTKLVCILRLEHDDRINKKSPTICISPRIMKNKISMKALKRVRIAGEMLEKNALLETTEAVEPTKIMQTAFYRAHLSYPPITPPPTAPTTPVRSAFAPRASAFRLQRVPTTPTTPTTRGYATTADFTPLIIPKPWEFAPSEDASRPAIRVPFLPDNEFSKYHRKEFVPEVQPPHRPAVSTVDADVSGIAATSSLSHTVEGMQGGFGDGGVLDEVLIGVESEKGPESESTIAPREDDMGPQLSEEKKTAMKVFAAGTAAWWVFGEPIMRLFGII